MIQGLTKTSIESRTLYRTALVPVSVDPIDNDQQQLIGWDRETSLRLFFRLKQPLSFCKH